MTRSGCGTAATFSAKTELLYSLSVFLPIETLPNQESFALA